MNLNKLRRKIRRQAKRESRAGRITQQQADQCEAIVADYGMLRTLNRAIEIKIPPLYCTDFSRMGWKERLAIVWDWFVANWPEILSIILKLAPLLLLEPDREDS